MKIPKDSMLLDGEFIREKLFEFFKVSSKLHEARKIALENKDFEAVGNLDRIIDEGISVTNNYLGMVTVMGSGHIPPRSEMN